MVTLLTNCVRQLEYDTERAGSFEPLKHLPRNKSVVLGIISSKLAKVCNNSPSADVVLITSCQLENPHQLRNRVIQAATVISDGEQKRSYVEALNQ